MSPPPDPPTAAILLIGNELLSGKIRDENGFHLTKVLRRRGIRVLEVATVPDEVDAIADALARLLARTPLLFTSGGVGPTHDDVTIAAIAAATGRALVRDPKMEKLLRAHYGDDIGAAALKMADVPDGTRLCAESGWPVLCVHVEERSLPGRRSPRGDARVFVLPGIPALFRAKVDGLESAGELPRAASWTVLSVRTTLDESSLAGPLDEIATAHPEVEIGSYPRWTPDERGRLRAEVRVILEASGPHAPQAQRAREALLARLDPGTLLPDADPGSEGTPEPA